MARREPGVQGTFDFGGPKPESIVPPYPGSTSAPERLPPRPEKAPEAARGAPAEVPRAEATPPPPLTVAGLGRLVERSLAATFEAPVVVMGEAGSVRFAQSGHLYFTLKDEDDDAAIDVVVYRTNVTPRARAVVRDGAQLLLRGRPSYYTPRGRLQFVADKVGLTGRGALLEALEKLKAKLAAEGLFREERKRPLPADPRTIGVVTSRTGAVIHDICRVAFRRGGAHVLLAAAQVQGATAAAQIVRALRDLERVPEVDVVILARGGGSTDDLAAFNDEAVVRAVAALRVPVVSAVGHEVDVTLVDFASDARASTPSQAAELVVPDARARQSLLAERRRGLVRAMRGKLASSGLVLASFEKRLVDPRLLVARAQQGLDDRRARLARAVRSRLTAERDGQRALATRISAQDPRAVLAREREALSRARGRIVHAASALLGSRETDVARLASRLDAMSPLKVLGRGYSIVALPSGRAVRSSREVSPGDRVTVRVAEGSFSADVVEANERGAS